MSKIKKQFKVDGMHCTSCAMTIDFDLEDVDGILNVETNYAQQVTTVEFDGERTTVSKIVSTIKKAGYQVRLND